MGSRANDLYENSNFKKCASNTWKMKQQLTGISYRCHSSRSRFLLYFTFYSNVFDFEVIDGLPLPLHIQYST